MCQPIIQSVSFNHTSYGTGALMTVTVNFTACCSGPFTFGASDTGGLTWKQSFTDGVSVVKFQASAVSGGSFTFTATVTSEDGLSDSQSWPFNVSGSSGSGGLVGGTTSPLLYGLSKGSTFAAAQQLDSFLPTGVTPAETVEKNFSFGSSEGVFNTSDPGLNNLLNNGVKVLLNVKPTRTSDPTTIASQQTALKNAIIAVLKVSSNVEVLLWDEANINVNGAPQFPMGGVTYAQYWANYAPSVQSAGAKCIYDPGTSGAVYAAGCAWFPLLSPVPDKFLCDFYYDDYSNGGRFDQVGGNPVSTTSFMALADKAGIPFGLGEFGYNNKAGTPTTDQIAMWGSPIPWKDSTGKNHTQSYMQYIISTFKTRLANNTNNADVVGFFSGSTAPNGTNYGAFLASGDFKSGTYTQSITGTDGTVSNQTILGLKQLWNAGV